jgi:hypothetical protein
LWQFMFEDTPFGLISISTILLAFLTLLQHRIKQLYLANSIDFMVFDEYDDEKNSETESHFLITKVFGCINVGLLWATLLIGIPWIISVYILEDASFYTICAGGLILYVVPLILAEVRSFVFHSQMRDPKGFKGRLKYPRWIKQKTWSVELLGYSILYLIFMIPAESAFIFGGAVSCLVMSIFIWIRGRRLEAQIS